MNFLLGRGLLGRYILGGPVRKAAAAVIQLPELDSGFMISIYDAYGIRTAVLSSDVMNHRMAELEFENLATGCGAFTLKLAREHQYAFTYGSRIDIALYGGAAPWYSGMITEKPLPGTTEEMATYSGYGFFNQLDDVLINKVYQGIDISECVGDMMTTKIEPSTKIRYNASKIIPTGYLVAKLRFDYVKAKEAVKTLSEFAANYTYGVDERRELFFKPLTTEINENSRFWVGYHVKDFKPSEDVSTVCNFFYVRGGKMRDDGTNIYCNSSGAPVPFADAESQELYGRKEDVLDVPSAIEGADIERWAYSELAKRKIPKRTATAAGFTNDIAKRNIKPEGSAIFTVSTGEVYQYPIKTVKYKLTGPDDITMTMQLGDYTPRLDRYIAQLYRNAKNAEFAQQLNNKQLKGVSV